MAIFCSKNEDMEQKWSQDVVCQYSEAADMEQN